MIHFTEDFDNTPYEELGIPLFCLFDMQRMLTHKEFKKIDKIEDDKEHILTVVNTLNNTCRLPRRYKHLVENYNEFEGIEPPYEDILY